MKRLISAVIVLFSAIVSLFASDYWIDSYDVRIVVGNNAVHHVTETIDVYFEKPHHGIVREIPYDYIDYNGTRARITGLSVSDEYSKDDDNGYIVLKIGSSKRTVTGSVRYVIEYDYDLGVDLWEGFDEFYMNIIGTQWECPIRNIGFTVGIPYVEGSGFSGKSSFYNWVKNNARFTSGSQGSTLKGSLEVSFEQNPDGSVFIRGAADNLGAYEGVTMHLDLPDFWYRDARQPWDYRPLMRILNPLVSILIAACAVIVWLTYGRDNVPVIKARSKAPEGLPPMMVGYIADSKVDDKDIASMLFYWADKGLLTIKELEEDKFCFIKNRDIADYAAEHPGTVGEAEIELFEGFFEGCEAGSSVSLETLGTASFFKTITRTREAIRKFFSGDKALVEKKSERVALLFILVSVVPMITNALRAGLYEYTSVEPFIIVFAGVLLFGFNACLFWNLFCRWYLRKSNRVAVILCAVPTLVCAVFLCGLSQGLNGTAAIAQNVVSVVFSTATALFGTIIQKRTPYGDKVLEETFGYRAFLTGADPDGLQTMAEEDPGLYYHALSYAIVLGLEKDWADRFRNISIGNPDWYMGYGSYNYYYMCLLPGRMTRNIQKQISSASVSASSQAGGSGFHASGFSGGGFGGGGGHAW